MSMNSFYTANQKNGAKVKKILMVPIDLLDFDPSRNIRPLNDEHVNNLAEEYRKNGPDALPPIKAEFRDDSPYPEVVEGFHRCAAALKAGITELPVQPFVGSLLQKTALKVKSSQGLALTALQRADAFLQMVNDGASLQDVANEVLTSKTDVEDKLYLARAPQAVREMVDKGLVSATEAIKVLRKHTGPEAEAMLAEAIKRALEKGKKKATNVDTKTTFSAAKARRAVELLMHALYDGAKLAKQDKHNPEFVLRFENFEVAKELVLIMEEYSALCPDAGDAVGDSHE